MVIASSSHYWTIAFGNQKGQVTSNQEKMMTMRKLAENIVWLAKKLHYRWYLCHRYDLAGFDP